MFTSPGSVAISLGSIQVRWYGICIVVGILFGYFYSKYETKRRGLNPELIDDAAIWLIAAGVIGARLYYVLFNLPYYLSNLAEIPQLWRGGLAIHGALIGGALAFLLYARRKKISPLAYADAIIPSVLFAQALGRWGNFFNNEAFGRPTSLPWKLFIPEEFRPSLYKDFSYFHPTFLYESLWNIIGFVILVLLSRNSERRPGFIISAYLAWYSVGRFFIESLRTDSLYLGPLRTAQLISIVLFIIGVCGLIFTRRKPTLKES